MKMHVRTVLLFALATFTALAYQNCGVMGTQMVAMRGTSPSSGSFSSGSAIGKAFFEAKISPMLKSACSSCHSQGSAGGNSKTYIFEYDSVFKLLRTSNSATTNGFYSIVRNINQSHAGGDQCATAGESDVACALLIDWWKLEFEKSAATGSVDGKVLSIAEFNGVYGYAKSISNPSDVLTIKLYVDGDKDSGQLVGETLANEVDGTSEYSGHFFQVDLAESVVDGKPHQLYAYAVKDQAYTLLGSKPTPFTMYAPKAAGMDYFTQTLEPKLQNCVGCHADFDYGTYYLHLASPTPAKGGTATTNFLIQKISGAKAHNGGNHCGDVNTSPCKEIQEWWKAEFN